MSLELSLEGDEWVIRRDKYEIVDCNYTQVRMPAGWSLAGIYPGDIVCKLPAGDNCSEGFPKNRDKFF